MPVGKSRAAISDRGYNLQDSGVATSSRNFRSEGSECVEDRDRQRANFERKNFADREKGGIGHGAG
jgi:hypothetical protein